MTLEVYFSIIKFGVLLIGVVSVLSFFKVSWEIWKTTIFQPIAVALFSVLKNVLAVSTGFTAFKQKAVLNRAFI